MNYIRHILNNKIVNNFIVLLTGDGISSILGIICTALMIKAIGMEKNGIILMVQSYALFFDQLLNFKSFEALIKYLSISIQNKDLEKSKSYINQSFYLDLFTALIATFMGVISIGFVSKFMGWNQSYKVLFIIYMLTVIFNLSGTCTGILRIYDKYKYISYINVIINVIRTLSIVIGMIMEAGFIYYFMVEVVLSIAKNILLIISSYLVLKENNLQTFTKTRLKLEKEFFLFNLYNNLGMTIDLPVNTISTFVLNKYLGFEIISVYKVFEKIGALVGKFSTPLNQIIYPEMNLMIAKNKTKKAIKLSIKLFNGILIVGIFCMFGVMLTQKYWLGALITNYQRYNYSLLLYLIYIILVNSTASIHSLFIALGFVKYILPLLTVINSIYLIILIPLISGFGLNGLIAAFIIQTVVVVLSKIGIILKNKANLNL